MVFMGFRMIQTRKPSHLHEDMGKAIIHREKPTSRQKKKKKNIQYEMSRGFSI